MKSFMIFIILFLSVTVLAEENFPINDGPYFFYDVDNAVIRYKLICDDSITNESISVRTTNDFSYWLDAICYQPLLSAGLTMNNDLDIYNPYDTSSKLFVFSDIHGEFESLCTLLVNNEIVTPDLHWNFGDGRLIVNGDMTDRGDKVTEILWMLYRLEQEALQAGGKIHFLLGNHEIMVMQGDLRYIHPKYVQVCSLLHVTYDQLFADQTEFGNWLRSKPLMMKINDLLFVHGGFNPAFVDSGYTIEYINQFYRDNVYRTRKDIRSDSLASLLFGSRGPTWYRGYFTDNKRYPIATESDIDNVLEYFDVSRIIVGHTGQDSIMTFWNGKVIGVNIDYEEISAYEGLYIENDTFKVLDYRGNERIIAYPSKD